MASIHELYGIQAEQLTRVNEENQKLLGMLKALKDGKMKLEDIHMVQGGPQGPAQAPKATIPPADKAKEAADKVAKKLADKATKKAAGKGAK